MSLFNAIYTLGGCRRAQPIQENSHIRIDFDSQRPCARATRWAKWVVTLPIHIAHGAFNTVYMLATKDINKVVSAQIYKGNSINRLQFLGEKSGHIFTSPKAIASIATHYRHDVEGPFERDSEDHFTPILKALFPKEPVKTEDFLFTCSRSKVHAFRDPLFEYIGPKALPHLRSQIDEVSKEVVEWVADRNTISPKHLAETFSVAILARLFLNHPGTLDDFQKIGGAASRVTEYQILKKWGKTNEEQDLQQADDLQTLRDAVEHSSGQFVNSLRKSGLSPIQVKGELLLVYVAGSETTSSTLQYCLWRLGQDTMLQDTIQKKPETVVNFIADSMLRYTPVTLFSRWARHDLVVSVQNRKGGSWKYPIAKGEGLIMAPGLAKGFVFGGGVHSCPGQWLARAEISSLISTLVNEYFMTSFPRKKELSTVPGFGFAKTEPAKLTLHKRR
jgi:cytochrome P450